MSAAAEEPPAPPPPTTTTLATHLTDRSLTPILTTARSRPQLESLTALTSAALTTHAVASRFGLGAPQRVMVEHAAGGPVVLCSFLSPDKVEGGGGGGGGGTATPTKNGTSEDGGGAGGGDTIEEEEEEGDEGEQGGNDNQQRETEAPMLVAVVAGAATEDVHEARRAAGRLERVAKEIQREWVSEGRGASRDGPE